MSNILKKIPLNTDLDDLYGKVKTVNSIRPDDDGNVLIKIPPVYEYNFLFNGVGYNSLVDALNNAKKDAANLLIVQNDVNLDDSERIEDSNGYKSIPDIDFDLEIDLNGNVLTSNKVHTDNSSGYIYGTLFHITGYSFYAHDGTIVTEPIGEYSFGPAVIFHLDNPYSDNTYTFTNLNLSSYSNDDGYCKTSDGTQVIGRGVGGLISSSVKHCEVTNCNIKTVNFLACVNSCGDTVLKNCNCINEYTGTIERTLSRGSWQLTVVSQSYTRGFDLGMTLTIDGGRYESIGGRDVVNIRSGGGYVKLINNPRIIYTKKIGLQSGYCFRLDNNIYVDKDQIVGSTLEIESATISHTYKEEYDEFNGTTFLVSQIGTGGGQAVSPIRCHIILGDVVIDEFSKRYMLDEQIVDTPIVTWMINGRGTYMSSELITEGGKGNPPPINKNSKTYKFFNNEETTQITYDGVELKDTYMVKRMPIRAMDVAYGVIIDR